MNVSAYQLTENNTVTQSDELTKEIHHNLIYKRLRQTGVGITPPDCLDLMLLYCCFHVTCFWVSTLINQFSHSVGRGNCRS